MSICIQCVVHDIPFLFQLHPVWDALSVPDVTRLAPKITPLWSEALSYPHFRRVDAIQTLALFRHTPDAYGNSIVATSRMTL